MAAAHRFSLISFRLKSNKATKVAPIVPTDSKQFQKSHFRSTETKKMLDRYGSRVRKHFNYKNSNDYQTYD